MAPPKSSLEFCFELKQIASISYLILLKQAPKAE